MREKREIARVIREMLREPETEEEKNERAKEIAEMWIELYGIDYILEKEDERIQREIELIRQGKSKPKMLDMLMRVFRYVRKVKEERGEI